MYVGGLLASDTGGVFVGHLLGICLYVLCLLAGVPAHNVLRVSFFEGEIHFIELIMEIVKRSYNLFSVLCPFVAFDNIF